MIFEGAKEFRVAKYLFELRAKEEIILPQYKGSTFRGAFGSVLKQICCANRNTESCRSCILKNTCPYAYVFETEQPPENMKIKRLRDAPRPFVLEPPHEQRTVIPEGERFSFGLVLIGKAIQLLPYFLITFKELGTKGIGIAGYEDNIPEKHAMKKQCQENKIGINNPGSITSNAERKPLYKTKERGWKKRGKYLLEEVKAVSMKGVEEQIYSHKEEVVKNIDVSFTLADITNLADLKKNLRVTSCTVQFLTPARIKSEGTLGSKLNFYSFFSRLIERIQALSIFHCEKPIEIDHTTLKGLSNLIETRDSSLHFVDWARYSSRQKTKMCMGGYMGVITFKGDLMPFLPFLIVGQYVHIGKNPTFGLGQYRLTYEEV